MSRLKIPGRKPLPKKKTPEKEVSDSVEKVNKPVENSEPKDLRDIMDYSLDFSIYYSGVENDTYFQGCYDMGVRYFLMSYHYLQGMRVPLEKKYGGLGVKFFIDSGAFTYHNDPKYKDTTVEEWEEHLKKYLKWAERNKDYIFAIANCDFELFLPGEQIRYWNEKYFEPFMLRTGIPVCFVHHENTVLNWEQYCQRYPYVGFSSANTVDGDLSFQQLHDKIRVAEKYNTLVHGFGMTKTSLLPKLPYYTVDSTSWKSGFRYGQLAFWNTNKKKVQMLKKEDFERAFQFIQNYDLDPPIDKEKIYAYYEPEVLRANVYAYQKAEEYIRTTLKALEYWKKARAKTYTKEDVDSLEFPSLEWLQGSHEGWEEWAEKFNISTLEPKFGQWTVVNMTVFLHWEELCDSEFVQERYTEDFVKSLHLRWVNKIRQTHEERLKDLYDFYLSNLMGEDDKLLLHGTNFDRMVKERDEYITDEEYHLEDVPEVEMQNIMSKYLPKKDGDDEEDMPEVDELDEELLQEQGIIAVRDESGRFLKGQREVLNPKKLYSNKYPKLACNNCVNAQKCPEYKDGYVCAFNKMFERYNTRDMNDIIQGMQGIADLAMIRLQRAMLAETMNGGIPDPAVSQLMNQTMSLYNGLQKMYMSGNQEIIRQTRTLKADGSQEVTTQVTSNPSSGGILEKIFGGLDKSDDIVDAESKEVE